MIISRAPLKVSLLGGGTDLKSFYKFYDGNVLTLTINKYVNLIYLDNPEFFDETYRLQYSDTEIVYKLNEIKNNIIRETFKRFKIKRKTHLLTFSDVPSGNGLGSSSAFCAALVNAIFFKKKYKINKEKLIKTVCNIEIEKVKSPIGKQDQSSVIYSGFNNFIFKKNEKIVRNNLSNFNILINEIENKCSLFLLSNQTVKREKILQNQIKKNLMGENIEILKKMAQISKNFSINLEDKKSKFLELADAVKESWELKKKVSKNISNEKLNEFLNLFDENKVLSYKLLGAGGKGFVLVFFKSMSQKLLFIKKNPQLRHINFKLSYEGVSTKNLI